MPGTLGEAIALHRSGNLDAARGRYTAILAANPHQVDALHFLGLLEHQCGRSERGLELMSRAIEREPGHADFFSNRGNVLKLLGRLEEAELDFRRALELAPNHVNAMNNLGTVMRERGEFEAAVELFRNVIALDPKHADAHQNLGNALGSLNCFEAALDAHREALRLRPGQGEYYRHLAGMYYSLGRIDEAAELYRQWLEIEPTHPIALHMLAASTGEDVPERASDDFVRKSFDQFAASFDRALLRLEYRAPTLVGAAISHLFDPPKGRLDVLDAGCGTGLVANLVRPYAKRLVGVDLSPLMVERAHAREIYDELCVEELVSHCERRLQHYDLIVSADTLVYFGALGPALSAMAGALRPSGTLIFTVERWKQAPPLGRFHLEAHGRYGHASSYVEEELKVVGFATVSVENVELRKEAGKWVDGLLVTARLPAVVGQPSAASPA